MKALELADSVDPLTDDAYANDWMLKAAAELRRLAEVNAELLEALEMAKQYLHPRVIHTGGEGETKVLPVIKRAITKATEQK